MSYLTSSLTLALMLLCGFSIAQAAPSNTCEIKRGMLGNTQVNTNYYADQDICWISVHPNNSYVDLVYRDFMFGNEGLFFVFNSFGQGSDANTTGAREFYTFPRRNYPEWSFDQNEMTITVVMSNGEKVIFDAETTRVKAMSDSNFTEASSVKPGNKGGFEMASYKNITLDCGFQMGNSPSANPKQNCKFTDPKQATCTVKAGEIFTYTSDGDNHLTYTDDLSLAKYLKGRCPNLDVTSLQ